MQTTQSNHTQAASTRTKSPFELDIIGRMGNAGGLLNRWEAILDELTKSHFAPASLVYEFINQCPNSFGGEANPRLEIVNRYREFVNHINFDPKDPSQITGRLAVLILLSSYYSPSEFLKQKTLVLLAYKALDAKVPKKLLDRITLCDHHQKNKYSEQDFLGAGYKSGISIGKRAFIHPDTGDTLITGTHKLTGSALLSSEEIEKRRLANTALRNEGRAKRFAAKANKSPKVRAPKKEEDTKGRKGDKKK